LLDREPIATLLCTSSSPDDSWYSRRRIGGALRAFLPPRSSNPIENHKPILSILNSVRGIDEDAGVVFGDLDFPFELPLWQTSDERIKEL
jgi:hypothetical protein